jgi:hypothetical protein
MLHAQKVYTDLVYIEVIFISSCNYEHTAGEKEVWVLKYFKELYKPI